MSETREHPDSRAHYWTMRQIHASTVAVDYGRDEAYVSVETEVPCDVDGQPVRKAGNRWHGSYVLLALPDGADLMPTEARALAHALLRAAEVAEAEDVQHTDACGHWAPCDCGRVIR